MDAGLTASAAPAGSVGSAAALGAFVALLVLLVAIIPALYFFWSVVADLPAAETTANSSGGTQQ